MKYIQTNLLPKYLPRRSVRKLFYFRRLRAVGVLCLHGTYNVHDASFSHCPMRSVFCLRALSGQFLVQYYCIEWYVVCACNRGMFLLIACPILAIMYANPLLKDHE